MADQTPPATPPATEPEAKPKAYFEPMLQFFRFAHLPAHLAEVSEPFCNLANLIVNTLPANPERTVSLRKLLESKDCAVRSLVYQKPR